MMAQPPIPSSAKPRTLIQRFADRLTTRLQRLPAPIDDYTVARELPTPMRDGAVLLSDVYTPTTTCKGTLLVRSPYGWQLPFATLTGSVYASRGYRVVLARCRGTFGSGGTFEPMGREVEDGADTVKWMRQQPWFVGRLATFGGSYLGFTQWALFMDPPPELVTAVISVAPHDFHAAVYQNGAFNLQDFLGWADQMAHQEDPLVQRLISMASSRRRLSQVLDSLSLVEAGERLLAGRSSWYRDWASRRDPGDSMWSPMKLHKALERVKVPVLLQSGWQDLFLPQTLEQHAWLAERGVDVALTVGPWTHSELITKGGSLIVRETLDWLDEHLGAGKLRARVASSKIFVTGADQWRDLPAWPPATRDHVLYPHADGGLGEQPSPDRGRATFTYDPADPTPTMGGRTLMQGGYTDDTSLGARRDVLTFTGPLLSTPLEVIGRPGVELAHVTDNAHADLFVRLSEVHADGTSRNVSDGFVRLDPGAADGRHRLELDAIAHRFAAGHRIRLVVAGGCHPHWERNLGTGEDPATSVRLAPSQRTIELASSRLVLPVGA
jgi:putative CocE/NonD family hydrolase